MTAPSPEDARRGEVPHKVARKEIARAAGVLRTGGLVAFPTETVYGLGADASNSAAVRRVYELKGRPPEHPVIVHLGVGADLVDWVADVPNDARRLAEACWPGPLTLVLRRRADRVVDEVTGGRPTVAVRVPGHPVALALLEAFGGGIAAPSANRFGRVSPTTAVHVVDDLGANVDVVLDGGPCTVGVESTIVDCTGPDPVVLRLGGVTEERLTELLGRRPERRTTGEVAAPGTLASHYAPRAKVEVATASTVAAAAARLAVGGRRVGVLALVPPSDLPSDVIVLDPPTDVDDYARVLYERLREADRRSLDVLVVVAPPEEGIGAAVADRLRRSASR